MSKLVRPKQKYEAERVELSRVHVHLVGCLEAESDRAGVPLQRHLAHARQTLLVLENCLLLLVRALSLGKGQNGS